MLRGKLSHKMVHRMSEADCILLSRQGSKGKEARASETIRQILMMEAIGLNIESRSLYHLWLDPHVHPTPVSMFWVMQDDWSKKKTRCRLKSGFSRSSWESAFPGLKTKPKDWSNPLLPTLRNSCKTQWFCLNSVTFPDLYPSNIKNPCLVTL